MKTNSEPHAGRRSENNFERKHNKTSVPRKLLEQEHGHFASSSIPRFLSFRHKTSRACGERKSHVALHCPFGQRMCESIFTNTQSDVAFLWPFSQT